jgi:hypothetical protein
MSFLTANYGYWEFWEAYDPANGYFGGHKVTFDGINKRIIVNEGVTEVDIKEDVYSDWKEWVQVRDNAKYEPALRTTGGDPAGSGQFTGDFYFLINDWQIEVSALVKFTGIIYSDNPDLEPFVINPGGGVISTVSLLAQSVETSSGSLTAEQAAQLLKILQNQAALETINEGVKNASLLIPHTTDVTIAQ